MAMAPWSATEQSLELAFLLGCLLAMAVTMCLWLFWRLRQRDKELRIQNQQLIEAGKLASMGELAASLAHELNNPVAIMVEEAGYIKDILPEVSAAAPCAAHPTHELHSQVRPDSQNPQKPESASLCIPAEDLTEARRAADSIRAQGARFRDITRRLLSFARKSDPNEVCTLVNQVVDEVMAMTQHRLRGQNITLEMRLAEVQPAAITPSELQQVLLNLVNNAVDAMPKGGTLKVTTQPDGTGTILVVEDTGQGIPRDALPHVFEPFFTTKPRGKGTGLGLAISRSILRERGGDIRLLSVEGRGTVFTLHIPGVSTR